MKLRTVFVWSKQAWNYGKGAKATLRVKYYFWQVLEGYVYYVSKKSDELVTRLVVNKVVPARNAIVENKNPEIWRNN